MFSSNPFPMFSSSLNLSFTPYFLSDHEKDCTCFNYDINNSDPFISGDCVLDTHNSVAPPCSAIANLTTIKKDFCWQEQNFFEGTGLQSCEDHDDDLLDSVISSCKKKTVASKKHGYTKIYTARGPRDRRVRLSIDISRKFFCLQDLLGFDKASKTLDWLFGKCKTAIEELVKETNHCPSSITTYPSKRSFLEAIMGGHDGGKSKKKSQLKDVDGKRKKKTRRPKGGLKENLPRDNSRAVARARARERAREKTRIRKLDDDSYYQNFKSSAGENHWVISAHPTDW